MTTVTETDPRERVIAALESAGVAYRLITHGRVRNLAEAAEARGVEPADVVKTLVVRRGQDDYVFVLVPGDRTLSWPKVRQSLGVSRLSMPDAADAQRATGFARGTITPFGSTTPWPVLADHRLRGRAVTLGAGGHGMAVAVDADDALTALDAQLGDLTEPE
jgi:Cys-tRNA(Pro)/Cys-tRNA(Cys) deacylase